MIILSSDTQWPVNAQTKLQEQSKQRSKHENKGNKEANTNKTEQFEEEQFKGQCFIQWRIPKKTVHLQRKLTKAFNQMQCQTEREECRNLLSPLYKCGVTMQH